jgi:hypothetical protein
VDLEKDGIEEHTHNHIPDCSSEMEAACHQTSPVTQSDCLSNQMTVSEFAWAYQYCCCAVVCRSAPIRFVVGRTCWYRSLEVAESRLAKGTQAGNRRVEHTRVHELLLDEAEASRYCLLMQSDGEDSVLNLAY